MHRRNLGFVGLGLILGTTLGSATLGSAQEIQWRPATPRSDADRKSLVTLGKPQPIYHPEVVQTSADVPAYIPLSVAPVARGQFPDPPPPPPPGPLGGPLGAPLGAPLGGPNPGEEAYNCGVSTNKAGEGGFFSRLCDNIKKGFGDVGGSAGSIFQPGPSGSMFHSDDKFPGFISPVSNPFYFEDPRALTELRPVFIWQHTPRSNPIFSSSDNFYLGLQARVAFTENISLVVSKLGFIRAEPNAPGFSSHTGLSEIHLGPKLTIIRNETTNTLLAVGLTFEIPAGPARVFQDTGDLSLVPYLSFGQSFGRSEWGTFNFLNTTGYVARVDSTRTDNVFTSFHLDYDVGNLKKIYPLVELNFAHYTFNGSARSFGFEGRDLFNFGSDGTAGKNELTLAIGARYKVSEALQFGLTGETSVLGGGRHMDRFRATFDVIFRY